MTFRQLQYRSAVQAAALARSMLAQHDLRGILNAIDKADSIGPILDPLLWAQKTEAMNQDAELLQAALPLWKYVNNRYAKGGA